MKMKRVVTVTMIVITMEMMRVLTMILTRRGLRRG